MKGAVVFVDNFKKIIDLQKKGFISSIQMYNEKCKHKIIVNADDCQIVMPYYFGEKSKGDSIKIDILGIKTIIEEETKEDNIKKFINDSIICLCDNYDLIHLVIDCNLNMDDKDNTACKFVNEIEKIDNCYLNKIILSLVSGHYLGKKDQENILNSIENVKEKKIVFIYRPISSDAKRDEHYWDEKQSSNGEYSLADELYKKYGKIKVYEVIEEMLYGDSAAANFVGSLLVRFLRDDDIDDLI